MPGPAKSATRLEYLSLGCDKNLVDTEKFLAWLNAAVLKNVPMQLVSSQDYSVLMRKAAVLLHCLNSKHLFIT